MKRLRATSAKPVVLSPVFPNVGVQAWYQSALDSLINESTAALLSDVAHAWARTPPVFHNSHITAYYGDSAKMQAAGVAFHSGGKILLMRRTDGAGWAFPGGGLEENETFEQAARREAFEETLHAYNGLLEPYRLQEWRGVNFATYSADVPEQFTPALNIEHDAFKWVTLPEALELNLHPGVRLTLQAKFEIPAQDCVTVIPGRMTYTDADYDEDGFTKEGAGVWEPEQYIIAMDAPSPTKGLQAALAKWGTQTIKRFDLMAQRIADDFATRSQRATQISIMGQFKKAGFTVAFKPTRESIEAYRIVAAENVGLIRSIPRKYHAEVEQKVWNAVRNGSDLNKLSTELRKAYGSTIKRAALIARDQNAKAKAVIERVRQQELGIRRGIWMHSNAGKEPRPTHVAMNGKPYDLAKGMWDSDEKEWVHPGQLINCRCTMKPVIEGFED